MKKVLVVGSGPWADLLFSRYSTVSDLDTSLMSFREAISLSENELRKMHIFVLASRPANNFEFLRRHKDSQIRILVEKPLIFNEESLLFFETEIIRCKLFVNYQYQATSAWEKFEDYCKRNHGNQATISIKNIGPKSRSYLAPALDYGSHVLSLVWKLKNDLMIDQSKLIIRKVEIDENRHKVAVSLDKISINLDYGLAPERECTYQMEVNGSITLFNDQNVIQSPKKQLLNLSSEPVVKMLRAALQFGQDSDTSDIEKSVEIYKIYQKINILNSN